MAFRVDTQTINDLKMVGDSKGRDVYTLYNKTKTRGGAAVLKDMFLYPRSRKEEINGRVNVIKYFLNREIRFPFDNQAFDSIDFYLSNADERTKLSAHEDNLKRKFDHLIGSDADYKQLYKGILSTYNFLVDLSIFVASIDTDDFEKLHKDMTEIKALLSDDQFSFLKNTKKVSKLSYQEAVKYDRLLRFTIQKEITRLLHYAYDIDVFVALAEVAKGHDMVFAEIHEGDDNLLEIEQMYHPLVPNAVANDLRIDESGNMIFLTGANMAGKSTIMKTFSITVYLAHMGFPLPAKSMKFSVQNGMFTTINLADNLNMGFSHFYAEVNRVKRVAESVNTNDRLIVVFDELFRGTNVKDAYDATVAVADAFAGKRKCTFIISTHIIEAGEDLKKLRDNIRFMYMPTVMNGHTPEYPYTISEGITSDRHGMVIIENEKILDILKK